MSSQESRAELIRKVLKQILVDLTIGDITALELLIEKLPTPQLEAYLSQEDQNETL